MNTQESYRKIYRDAGKSWKRVGESWEIVETSTIFEKSKMFKIERKDEQSASIESLKSSIAELPAEERLAIVERDSPELLSLLSEFETTMKDLKTRLLPIHEKVTAGEINTKQGMSLLDA